MTPWAEWRAAFADCLAAVPDTVIQKAAQILLAADVVVTAGNGGSSAIASHFAQAIAKPDYRAGKGRGSFCASDNIPTLTAHANDGGWETALMETARPILERVPRAVLVAISSSGRSKNVVKLVELAKDIGHPIVTMTGFEGEPIRSMGTVSLHVPAHEYELVEPAHEFIAHRLQVLLRTLGASHAS